VRWYLLFSLSERRARLSQWIRRNFAAATMEARFFANAIAVAFIPTKSVSAWLTMLIATPVVTTPGRVGPLLDACGTSDGRIVPKIRG